MSKVHSQIDGRLREFIEAQHIFFVGTAPLAEDGHINLSPKGHQDTFRVIDGHTVAYLDLTGSGSESIAHVRENGRIVVMFCAFDGPPNIVRLHGRGRVVTANEPDGPEWFGLFPDRPGARAVVVVSVERVSDSCGFSIPEYEYQGDRQLLDEWAGRKSEAELDAYRATKNAASIDGLPSIGEPSS
ncbi:MAG: pyridoxamine 5'-phosphate oxidase family protein [Candidatus Nanopelagicales bacterium]